MRIIHFRPDHAPELADAESVTTDGFHWLDIERSESDWEEKTLPLLGAWYGPWALSGAMLVVVAGLLLWFRGRHWI